MSKYQSTKVIELGSCAFRQWRATHSHCQYLHGYQLKAKLWFGCNELDDKNWCVDFGGFKKLKAYLKELFDHTTTVAADDPELATFEDLAEKGIIQLRVFADGVGIEKVAEVVFNQANDFVKSESENRCWVDKVEVFEHEDNSATYSNIYAAVDADLLWTEDEIIKVISGISGGTSTETQPLEQTDVKVTKTVVKDEDVPEPTAPAKKSKSALPDLPGASTKTKGDWFKGTTWG